MNLIRNLCRLLSSIIGVYSLIIVVRIVISWFKLYDSINGYGSQNGGYGYTYENKNGQKKGFDRFYDFLKSITDPYLNLFRGVKALRRPRVDFTPVLALIVLNVSNTIFSMISQTGRITLGVILAIIVDGLWGSLLNLILLILVVVLGIRYIVGLRKSFRAKNFVDSIDPMLEKPVGMVYNLFFKKSKGVSDQKLVLVSFVFYLILLIVLGNVERLIVSWLISF